MKKFEMALASAFGVFVCIIVYRSIPWDYLLIKDSVAIIVSGLFGISIAAVMTDTRELFREVRKAIIAMPSVKKLFERGFPTMDYDGVLKCFRSTLKLLASFFRWVHSWIWVALSNVLSVPMLGVVMCRIFGLATANDYTASAEVFSVMFYGMVAVVLCVLGDIFLSSLCFVGNIQLPFPRVNEWFRKYQYLSSGVFFEVQSGFSGTKSIFPDASQYPLTKLERLSQKYFWIVPMVIYTTLLNLYAIICFSALITAFIVEIPVMLINLSIVLATSRRMAVMEGVLAGYTFSFWQGTNDALWVLVSMAVGVLVTLGSYELRQRKISDVWTRLWLLPACINPSQRVCGL